ncbi:hypothetical protein [Flagellimonas sp.]|uniref:hypothetical protein n=1 Tax=Flagellimonas sp. TaxID=2058762 RepID=UPI003F49D4D8
MRKSNKTLFLIFGIALMAVSCEATSVAEEESMYNEISQQELFDIIKPTGTVTPKNIRKPGTAKKNK